MTRSTSSTRQRIKELVIPPAWKDVWICPWPNGHIQAIGFDAAGRKQYLYHPDWRRSRDAEKHQRVLELARALPRARELVAAQLELPAPTRERTLAAAFRMLDLGFFRIGSESYAEANGTFGLATMRREHVSVHGDSVLFEFVSKGSIQQQQRIVDPDLARVLRSLLRRRDPNPDLLAWRQGRGEWRDLRSEDVNEYVREVTRGDHTAKDFRTWNATVLMAQALAVSTRADASPTARKRAVTRAVREVADYLGNTPTVARGSYIDARIIDLYLDGVTIDPLSWSAGWTATACPSTAQSNEPCCGCSSDGFGRLPNGHGVPVHEEPEGTQTQPVQEPVDARGVTPEPEGAETPTVWPAAAGGILGAFIVAMGIIVSTPWLWVLGIVIMVLGVFGAPVMARLPRNRKGGRRTA